MRLLQTIKTAFSSIARNKLRTGLTMLGLIIGVSSVIVLTGIGDGSNKQVEERMESLGGDIISAFLFESPIVYKDLEDLSSLPGIAAVAPSKNLGGDVTVGGKKAEHAWVVASDEQFLFARNLKLAAGRGLSSIDRENRSNVVVIGEKVALKLFGSVACLGKTLNISGVPFLVVGVLENSGETMGADTGLTVVVPITASVGLGGDTKIDSLYARPLSNDTAALAKNAVVSFFALQKGLPTSKFMVNTQDEMMQASGEISNTMTLLGAGIACISLIVAGIGVMNVMLVSVTERTREIGIKKALGARRRDILLQFLIEALALSVIGGAVGVVAGLAVGALAASAGLAFSASGTVVALSVGASALIGLVFGILPANRASKLNPIEALRQE